MHKFLYAYDAHNLSEQDSSPDFLVVKSFGCRDSPDLWLRNSFQALYTAWIQHHYTAECMIDWTARKVEGSYYKCKLYPSCYWTSTCATTPHIWQVFWLPGPATLHLNCKLKLHLVYLVILSRFSWKSQDKHIALYTSICMAILVPSIAFVCFKIVVVC